jgi:acetyltransferase-like isoleucine patch superfamily enzyme
MSGFKNVKKRIKKMIRQLIAEDYGDIIFKNNETILTNKIYVGKNCSFVGTEFIHLGEKIIFGDGTKLVAISSFVSSITKQEFKPSIKIGNNVQVTANLQVYAMKEIVIEDNVLFASNVFISDGFHGYDRIDVAYKDQPISNLESIYIGEGSWIGQNVVILPGVSVGKFSIVGANSVITKSIPAYCIAAGVPARIIKRWDLAKNEWIQSKEEYKISEG